MLGNKDFANLVKSGQLSGTSDRVRFDLNQVSKWDKEISKSQKSRNYQTPNRSSVTPVTKERKEKTVVDDGYVDRALLRRKSEKSVDYELDEMENLPIEATKFLGGDIEHTHLVKGLDYALLNKMRSEQKATEEVETEVLEPEPTVLLPVSALGKKLKTLLLDQPDVGLHSNAAKALASVVYEFGLDERIATENDIPMTISRSKMGWRKDDSVNFMLSSDLQKRIAALFDAAGNVIPKAQRKSKDAKNMSEASATTSSKPVEDVRKPTLAVPSARLASDFDSIYDDDVPVGKYVPEGAVTAEDIETEHTFQMNEMLWGKPVDAKAAKTETASKIAIKLMSLLHKEDDERHEEESSKENRKLSVKQSLVGSSSAQKSSDRNEREEARPKGFQLPRMGARLHFAKPTESDAFGGADEKKATDSSRGKGKPSLLDAAGRADDGGDDDVLKPVKDLLVAQMRREKRKEAMESQEELLRRNQIVVETDKEGNKLIHRDVFATTSGHVVDGAEVVSKAILGDKFGAGSGSIFNDEDMEGFDSDEGGEDGGVVTKKMKLGGGVSRPTAVKSSGGGGGLNRAARRALMREG